MKKYKKWLFGAAALLTLLLIGSIWLFREKEEKPYYVICIFKNFDVKSGFWESVMGGANLAAEDYDLTVSFLAPEHEGDIEGQIAKIHEAIEKKPDAILLAAADYEKTYEAAKEIEDAGIKLVLIDSGVKEGLNAPFVATNNFDAGIKMGALIRSKLQSEDKMGIISFVKGTSTAIERERGVRMGINVDEDRIVEVVYGESDYATAKRVTKELLVAHPEITWLAALNQYASVGAGQAVEEMGLTGKVRIVGFDNSIEMIQFLESGVLDAVVVQYAFNIGYQGVEMAVKTLNGEKVEDFIDSGSALISRDNMYNSLNQKLLFPFVE